MVTISPGIAITIRFNAPCGRAARARVVCFIFCVLPLKVGPRSAMCLVVFFGGPCGGRTLPVHTAPPRGGGKDLVVFLRTEKPRRDIRVLSVGLCCAASRKKATCPYRRVGRLQVAGDFVPTPAEFTPPSGWGVGFVFWSVPPAIRCGDTPWSWQNLLTPVPVPSDESIAHAPPNGSLHCGML